MFKTYSSSSSLVITSRWFATSRLRTPVSVRLVYCKAKRSSGGKSITSVIRFMLFLYPSSVLLRWRCGVYKVWHISDIFITNIKQKTCWFSLVFHVDWYKLTSRPSEANSGTYANIYLGPISLTAFPSRWKFRFTLISILIQWSLQNFVHGTTAVLSWHVQNLLRSNGQ